MWLRVSPSALSEGLPLPHLQRSNNKDRMHLLQNRLLVLLPNRLPLVTLFLDHINESYIGLAACLLKIDNLLLRLLALV